MFIEFIENELYDKLFSYSHSNYDEFSGKLHTIMNARPVKQYNGEKVVVYDIVFVETFDYITSGPHHLSTYEESLNSFRHVEKNRLER